MAALGFVAGACGDDGTPAATSAPSATTATTAPGATTAAGTTTVPAGSVAVLVADATGIRLWSEDGRQRTVVDRPAAVALPDRVGGLVFQEAETGRWQQELTEDRVRWRWVGEGAARPIKRMATLDAPEAVVVTPPEGASLRAVDVAVVDGRPTLAYLRIRHQEVPAEDVFASALAELVVRDLASGRERVVRTQEVGWESDDRTSALGDDGLIETVVGYGEEFRTVAFFDLDGRSVMPPYEPPDVAAADQANRVRDWCGGEPCDLRADLAPTGPELAYARLAGVGAEQDAPMRLEVVVVDRRTGSERTRAVTTVPARAFLGPSLDTVAGRTLVDLVTWEEPAERPELRRGDEGPWVRLLQERLADFGHEAVPLDGVFGAVTEAAVRAHQEGVGLPATGVVDGATWATLGSPSRYQQHLLLAEPDGTVRTLPVFGTWAELRWYPTWPSVRIWTG